MERQNTSIFVTKFFFERICCVSYLNKFTEQNVTRNYRKKIEHTYLAFT